MKLSVCLDALFSGEDFMQSMKEVKKIGFNNIEFWSWWDKDLEKIEKAQKELNMNILAFCTKSISLVDSSQRQRYKEGIKDSIKTAKLLNCSNLITQVGNELKDITRQQQHKNIVDGIKECVPMLEEQGITLLIEPLNTIVDHKGYYLYSSDQAFQIIEEVDSENVKVLYDIYHQQIMEGNLISKISQNIDKIGHFHAAGNPGRHELYVGEINYDNIFKAIDQCGFDGYVGLEYHPLNDTLEGLKHIKQELR